MELQWYQLLTCPNYKKTFTIPQYLHRNRSKFSVVILSSGNSTRILRTSNVIIYVNKGYTNCRTLERTYDVGQHIQYYYYYYTEYRSIRFVGNVYL